MATRVTEVIHFNFELDMLEAHVIEASKYADRIVVKEAALQWSGSPKRLYGKENYKRFKKYPKVEFLELPTNQFVVPRGNNIYDIRINENLTRQLGWKEVSDAADYIIECDVDEIIDVSLYSKLYDLMSLDEYLHVAVTYRNFIWFMDWCSGRHQEYRVFKTGEPEICLLPKGRHRTSSGKVGWHFSGCFSGEDWVKKYTSMPQTYGFTKEQAESIDWNGFRNRRVRPKGVSEVRSEGGRQSNYKYEAAVEIPLSGGQLENVSLTDYPEFVQKNPGLFPWSGGIPGGN